MPPKATFTGEQIIDAAHELVRREGIDFLTARNLAEALGSSTQPIYRFFPTMEILEESVIQKSLDQALNTMVEYTDPEGHFLSIGLGYLHFARSEPKLFQVLFMSGRKTFDIKSPDSPLRQLFTKMRKDPFLKEIREDLLQKLLVNMFIFTHGICTLGQMESDTSHPEERFDRDRERLLEMGGNLIALAHMKQQNKLDIETMMRRLHDENCGS